MSQHVVNCFVYHIACVACYAAQFALPQGNVCRRVGAPPLSEVARREEGVAGKTSAGGVSR